MTGWVVFVLRPLAVVAGRPGPGGGGDQGASAALQVRFGLRRRAERSVDVRRGRGVPVLVADLRDLSGQARPGVADNHVDPAEGGGRSLEESSDILTPAHIGGHSDRTILAAAVDGLLQRSRMTSRPPRHAPRRPAPPPGNPRAISRPMPLPGRVTTATRRSSASRCAVHMGSCASLERGRASAARTGHRRASSPPAGTCRAMWSRNAVSAPVRKSRVVSFVIVPSSSIKPEVSWR